jgi:hypothetical protein
VTTGLALVATMLALSIAGCGSGTACFGGDCRADDDKEKTVVVEGNVLSVLPPNPVRDVGVYVYTGLDAADRGDGPPFDVYSDAEAMLVGGDGSFEIQRVSRGRLTVILARDTETQPNGVIDPGDECSVLLDSGRLSDVPGGRRVTLEDLRVNFAPSSCPNQPPAADCGCTRADRIRITTERSGDD